MKDHHGFCRETLKPGTLWPKIKARASEARNRGILHAQTMSCTFMEQDGICFPVCIMTELKRQSHRERGVHVDDALGVDQDLYITDLTPSHICALGTEGFSDHQLIIKRITNGGRKDVLDHEDLLAVTICLEEIDSLVFFDSAMDGKKGDKRIQLAPLPLTPDLPALPLDPLVRDAVFHGPIGSSTRLPFTHAVMRLPDQSEQSVLLAALERGYQQMLHFLGLQDLMGNLKGSYDLLITRRWMMIAPRSRQCYESISLDALAFSGMICVRDEKQARLLERSGPLSVLRYIGRS